MESLLGLEHGDSLENLLHRREFFRLFRLMALLINFTFKIYGFGMKEFLKCYSLSVKVSAIRLYFKAFFKIFDAIINNYKIYKSYFYFKIIIFILNCTQFK